MPSRRYPKSKVILPTHVYPTNSQSIIRESFKKNLK